MLVGSAPGAYPDIQTARQAIAACALKIGVPEPAIFSSTDSVSALWPFPNFEHGSGPSWTVIVREGFRIAGLRCADVTVGDASAALMAVQEASQ